MKFWYKAWGVYIEMVVDSQCVNIYASMVIEHELELWIDSLQRQEVIYTFGCCPTGRW